MFVDAARWNSTGALFQIVVGPHEVCRGSTHVCWTDRRSSSVKARRALGKAESVAWRLGKGQSSFC